jgi:hypothetical protein
MLSPGFEVAPAEAGDEFRIPAGRVTALKCLGGNIGGTGLRNCGCNYKGSIVTRECALSLT